MSFKVGRSWAKHFIGPRISRGGDKAHLIEMIAMEARHLITVNFEEEAA